MCGRFTLSLEPNQLQAELGITDVPLDFQSRFNIAPSQLLAVVTDGQKRTIEKMKWGLVPSWAKDVSIGNRMINARSETLVEKPSFRNAFQRRRCLILADGFYEWMRKSENRATSIPYYFQIQDAKPFAFAGLWEIWKSPLNEPLLSCTIITTQANQLVATIHERMPVILDKEACWSWLEPHSTQELLEMLVPYPAERMSTHPVSRAVNDPAHDTRDCILPVSG